MSHGLSGIATDTPRGKRLAAIVEGRNEVKPDAWKLVSKYRIREGKLASGDELGNNGAFMLPVWRRAGEVLLAGSDKYGDCILAVIVSDMEAWDHVSVSLQNRCPSWEEMCFIKSLFFEPEETAMQLHPKQSEYVNFHEHCLHLWRPQNRSIPLPPSIFVGPRKIA